MQIKESLDTSVIVRLITRDIEPLYKKAVKLVSREGVQFILDDVAVAEAVHVLTKAPYQFGRAAVRQMLTEIMKVDNILCDYDTVAGALDEYAANPSLSFDDCLLAAKAAAAEAEPLWTFDHKLAVQSGTAKEVK